MMKYLTTLFMKRFIVILLLVMAVSVLLAGCTSSPEEKAAPPSSAPLESSAVTPEETPALEKTSESEPEVTPETTTEPVAEPTEETVDVLVLKGQDLYNAGKYDEAIVILDRALVMDSTDKRAIALKSRTLFHMDNIEEALALNDQLIKASPDNVGNWNEKGSFLNASGRYDEAIEAYDHAFELMPNFLSVYNKGQALTAQGKYPEAVEAFKQAQEMAPEDSFAKQALEEAEQKVSA